MSHIQLYAKIQDIYPTEHWILNLPKNPDDLVDPDEKALYETNGDAIKAWKDDIFERGINKQLHIHPTGLIGDGNSRYWCSRKLYEETSICNFYYVPINLKYFMGLNYNKEHLTIRKQFLEEGSFYEKKTVLYSNVGFPQIDMDSLFTGQSPFGRVTQLASFKEIK